jgi:hypothetical protein
MPYLSYLSLVCGIGLDYERAPRACRLHAQHQLRESMIGIARDHSPNVKRWRNGQMALRRCAAGLVEARAHFRRVKGHLHLRELRAALQQHVAADNVGNPDNNETVTVA